MFKWYTTYIRTSKDFYRKFFDFKGVTSRRNFWLCIWFNTITFFVLTITSILIAYSIPILHIINYLPNLYVLLILIPNLSLLVRRIRDTGYSLWWLAIYLIPIIGLIVLLILTLLPSKQSSPHF